jgi:hypothetical protein
MTSHDGKAVVTYLLTMLQVARNGVVEKCCQVTSPWVRIDLSTTNASFCQLSSFRCRFHGVFEDILHLSVVRRP